MMHSRCILTFWMVFHSVSRTSHYKFQHFGYSVLFLALMSASATFWNGIHVGTGTSVGCIRSCGVIRWRRVFKLVCSTGITGLMIKCHQEVLVSSLEKPVDCVMPNGIKFTPSLYYCSPLYLLHQTETRMSFAETEIVIPLSPVTLSLPQPPLWNSFAGNFIIVHVLNLVLMFN